MAEKLVIDASVAAKWFLDDEKDVDLAESILAGLLAGALELHAPSVFLYEVCALLTKACGSRTPAGDRRLSRADGIAAVRELFGLEIQLVDPTESTAVASLELAVDSSKNFKDMSYLTLADRLDCRWCTADDKVLLAIPTAFPASRVLILSTLRPPT